MGKKPQTVDAMLAEWRARGLDFSEGRTARLPEKAPETRSNAISPECAIRTPEKRKSKYGAIRTEVDGIVFDSKKEAKRYIQLKAMEEAGEVRDLQLQPKYDLVVNGVKIGKYVADFKYLLKHQNGFEYVVEDCKGMKTPVYRLKKKLVLALHGIEIKET